jgi:protein phosphatase
VPRQELPQPQEDPKAKRRKRFRWLVGTVVVLIVLAAAAIATRYFVLSQYYVGVGQDDEVVIYRGVPGSILGIDLHSFEQGSCPPGQQCTDLLRVDQLQEDARLAVQNGVKKDNLDDARQYIDGFLQLHKRLNCGVSQPGSTSSTPTPTVTPTSGAPSSPVSPSANQPPGRDCSTPSSTAPTTGGGN